MAEQKEKKTPVETVENKENEVKTMIDGLVERAQVALHEFLALDQEQIDHIVHEMALAGLDKHQELARMAVEETGRGVYEDKTTLRPTSVSHARHWRAWLARRGVKLLQKKALPFF